MRHRAGLSEIDRVPVYFEPRRDDIAERDELGNRSVRSNPIHAIVMAIGDEESAAERLQRVLHSRRNDEGESGRRVVACKRADVRNEG